MLAFEGYIENGRLYPVGLPAGITGRRKAIITVLDEPAGESALSENALAWETFLKGIKNITDEPLPEEFERVRFRDTDI